MDGYGGVIMYVKDKFHYKCRPDLEILGLECLWVEVMPSHSTHVLISVFYIPPNSDINYLNLIDHSLNLPINCGISDIIVTGEFNLNQTNPYQARKLI